MKVLFVTHCTGMGGANRSMLQLILELRDNHGVHPFVLLPPSKEASSLSKYLDREKIEYREENITFFKSYKPDIYRKYESFQSYRYINSLCEELRSYGFDLVHSNSSVMDFGAYVSQRLGVRHIWHLREFGDLDYEMTSSFGPVYEYLAYSMSDVYIAISDVIKKHFSNVIDPARIVTIYNGIALRSDVPLAQHKNEVVQFLCAGMIAKGKNQIEILQALDELVNVRHIHQIHVTIVGGGLQSEYATELIAYVHEHQLGEYVTLMDEVDGIATLASNMDVGIVPSKCEAFGRVTVEYMLQDLAVIANDNGANLEIVEDGSSGMIYSHDQPKALADCMQRLISDKSLLCKLASKGRERAKSCFLSTRNSESVYRLYCDVLGGKFSSRSALSRSFVSLCLCFILYFWGIFGFFILHYNGIKARMRPQS